MTATAVGSVPAPERRAACQWVATAGWHRSYRAVSVTDGHWAACVAVTAPRLVEVVARAAEAITRLGAEVPGALADGIDLRVQLGGRVAGAYRDSRDRRHATAILDWAGLCRDDVDAIVLSRLVFLLGLAHAPRPDDRWGAQR
jgi:hypothetical protein